MFNRKLSNLFGETVKFGVEEAKKLEEKGDFNAAILSLEPVLQEYPKKKTIRRYYNELKRRKADDDLKRVREILNKKTSNENEIGYCFEVIKSAMDDLNSDNVELNILNTQIINQLPFFLKERLDKGDNLGGYATCLVGHEILFGLYEVISILGRGRSGITFLCLDKHQDRKCAIKLIPSGDKERFDNEVKLQARLEKSYKVPIVYSSYQIGDDFYMVMEFIEGGDLLTHIEKETLTEKEAVFIAIQICDILDTAHKENICHLDIKPANILLDKHKHVKISDFGLARLIGSNLQTLWAGTKHYTAPEIIRGHVGDHLSDIYSLGVVLWEMLGNAMPIVNNSHSSHITSDLVRICKKATLKNPASRFQSVKEMQSALEVYVNSTLGQTDERCKPHDESADYAHTLGEGMLKISGGILIYLDMQFQLTDFLIDKCPVSNDLFNKFVMFNAGQIESNSAQSIILRRIWTADGMSWMRNNLRQVSSDEMLDLNWEKYVDDITWYEAVAFCNWRSMMTFAPHVLHKKNAREIVSELEGVLYYGDDGPITHGESMGFSLPTEFELEMAKRFSNHEIILKITDDFYEMTSCTYHNSKELKRYSHTIDPVPYIKGMERVIVDKTLDRKAVEPDCWGTYRTGFRCVLRIQ